MSAFALFTLLLSALALAKGQYVTINYEQFEQLIRPTVTFSEDAINDLENSALSSVHTAFAYRIPPRETDDEASDITDLLTGLHSLKAYGGDGYFAHYATITRDQVEPLVTQIYNRHAAWGKPMTASIDNDHTRAILRPVPGEVYAVEPIYRFFLQMHEALSLSATDIYNAWDCDDGRIAVSTPSGLMRHQMYEDNVFDVCTGVESGGLDHTYAVQDCTYDIHYNQMIYLALFSDRTYFAFESLAPTSADLTTMPDFEPLYMEPLEEIGLTMWSQHNSAYIVTTMVVHAGPDNVVGLTALPPNRNFAASGDGWLCGKVDTDQDLTLLVAEGLTEAPFDTYIWGKDNDFPTPLFSTALATSTQALTIMPEETWDAAETIPQQVESWVSQKIDRIDAILARINNAHQAVENTNKLAKAVGRFLPLGARSFVKR